MIVFLRRSALLLCLLMAPHARAEVANGIPWQRNDSAAFTEAMRDNRFVLLCLEAVWCHWCHVMDATTYADPRVRS